VRAALGTVPLPQHGFESLEIAGNFASMGINPDPAFEIELSTLAI
jgi:hypothetical protein